MCKFTHHLKTFIFVKKLYFIKMELSLLNEDSVTVKNGSISDIQFTAERSKKLLKHEEERCYILELSHQNC